MTDNVEMRTVLDIACREAGLNSRDARLLHAHSNTVYLLPREHAVARISHNDHLGLDARASVAITKWLARQGVPTTEPFTDHIADIGSDTVTFWHYYPPHGQGLPPARELGGILRELHAIQDMPFDLPNYSPLRGLTQTLADPQSSSALAPDDREWLSDRAATQIATYHQLRSHLGHGVVHGDAYTGNMLWGPHHALLGDWDEISIAPRELDLINVYQSARFGTSDDDLTEFARAYGWDVRTWDGYADLRAMRDLHTLTGYIRRASRADPVAADELRSRIRSLRDPEFADTRWHAYS